MDKLVSWTTSRSWSSDHNPPPPDLKIGNPLFWFKFLFFSQCCFCSADKPKIINLGCILLHKTHKKKKPELPHFCSKNDSHDSRVNLGRIFRCSCALASFQMSSTPFAPRENSEASDETPEREAGSQPMWLNVTLKHHRRLRERFRLSHKEKFISGGGCLIIKTTTPRIQCSWPVCLNDQIHNQSVIFPLRSWFWSCFRAWQKSIFQPEARWQKTPVTTEVLLFNNEHKDCVFSVCVCVCVQESKVPPHSQSAVLFLTQDQRQGVFSFSQSY